MLRLAKGGDGSSVDEIAKLVAERDNYKKQCQEMEKFLEDYGLKWIGNDEDLQQKRDNFNADAVKRELDHKAPQYRSNLPKEIDTAVLTRRIEELNFIAEKNKIVTNAYGMKELQEMAPVRIFFFKNGIIMKGFKFAPYYSK